MIDYSLWEVIKNGNKDLKKTVGTSEETYEPTSAEEKLDRRNEMKARGTLLMALPNKDQLKFIHTKMQNYSCKPLRKGIEETRNQIRIQKLNSQLEIQGEDHQTQIKIHKIWLLYPQTAQVALIKQIPLLVELVLLILKSYQAEEEIPTNYAFMEHTSSRSSSSFESEGNPQQKDYKEKGIIESSCFRHMTGNKCYLTNFEAYDGGFVSFGDGKGIENQIDCKVKVIRYDNGTEFKNSVMSRFCEDKGIKREFSVAITPQQNGIAEKRNRTLIEAIRTMALVTKPLNKTPYELIRRRPPLIYFMKPFGCLVTILNTTDNLGKFEGKADEGYFVGYSVDSAVDAGKKAPEIDESKASDNGGKNDQVPRNDTGIFGNAYDDNVLEEEVDINNIDSSYIILEATKFLKDHPLDQVIGSLETPVQIRQMSKIHKEFGLLSSVHKLRRTNHKDFQNYLFACFLSQMEPKKPVQALQDPSWVEAMQNELLYFKLLNVKTASTPMESNKPLIKDEEAKDLDVQLYKSMICSLMYLTASRPDITFAVCVRVRFQVHPKTSHLHDLKRIFRYLKGQPKLGLWYPKDSPFNLEASSDSNYAGAILDRKSTT
uniref:Ribonuclease H-like domain-containing protein n=1 Tax=Tanacetum cinerariifolium TaxID=118510 RepID=A0A699H7L9_TANCI|nr:ribonuclease H-like domain-containing protein [Tanacetum cinerariifolium]